MKKIVLAILSFMLLCTSVTAKSNKINAIEITTTGNNLRGSEQKLCNVIQEELEANLSRYTTLNIVNSTKKNEVIKGNKKGEGEIEVGKFKVATHALFLDITRINNSYKITIQVTDLTTNENRATITSNSTNNVDELYSGNGSIIDKLTIELCDRLNLELSPLSEKMIMKGEEALSDKEKEQLYNSDIKLYNKKIDQLNKELKNLRNANTAEEKLEKAAVEASIAKNEEQIRLAERSKERLLEDSKRSKAKSDKSKALNESGQNLINSFNTNIDDLLEDVKKKKTDALSSLEFLELVETLKEGYLDLKLQLDKEIVRRQEDIKGERDEAIKAIDAKPFKAAEKSYIDPDTGRTLDHKVPTEQALKNRQREKDYALEEIEKTSVVDMNNFISRSEDVLKRLTDGIEEFYKTIKPRLLTSLNDEIYVSYEKYDSVNYGWPINVRVLIDGKEYLNTKSFIPYDKLTGERPIKKLNPKKQEEYQQYLDKVDSFDKQFIEKKEILTFSMYYMVKPMSKDYPSKYEIMFDDFYFYDTSDVVMEDNKITSKAKGKLKLYEDTSYKQYYPLYDMRTDEEKDEWNRNAEKREREELKRQEKENRKKERGEDFNNFIESSKSTLFGGFDYHNENEDTSLASLKLIANAGGVNGTGMDLSYNYLFSEHFSFGASTRFIFSKDSGYYGLYYGNTGTVWNTLLQVGYSYNLENVFGSFDGPVKIPTVYVLTGLGIGLDFAQYTKTSCCFLTSTEIGLETTICDMVTVSTSMGMDWGIGKQKETNATAYTAFLWNLGVGYRF